MTDLKELRDLHNARSRFYDPLTASSFEVACIEALPALLDVAEAAEALDKQRLANSLNAPECSYLAEIKLGLAMREALARLTEGKP